MILIDYDCIIAYISSFVNRFRSNSFIIFSYYAKISQIQSSRLRDQSEDRKAVMFLGYIICIVAGLNRIIDNLSYY